MRVFALALGPLVVLAASANGPDLPAALKKGNETLAKAPSLTVEYTLTPPGGAPASYRLLLSRPDAFRLVTPTGFVVGDGKAVTTYTNLTKRYAQEPYTPEWAAAFAERPEILPWRAFFLNDPAQGVLAAKAGASRMVGPNRTDAVTLTTKRIPKADLYLDRTTGVARAAAFGEGSEATLLQTKSLILGKAALPATEFAFVAPEGASMEEPAFTFVQVKALIDDRCMPCHAGANPKAGIKLDTYEGVVATVVPGDPKASLLIKSVKGEGVRKMPLGNHPALTPEEIEAWSSWIASGAKND